MFMSPEPNSGVEKSARVSGTWHLLRTGFRDVGFGASETDAAPGFSEHHSGRAIDIATPGTRPLTVEFERSKAFAWLTANAAAFGFTMPYGRGNTFGFEFEPWHWSQLALPPQSEAAREA